MTILLLKFADNPKES